MNKTKERWEEISRKVQNNVDVMDTNHWFYLNDAIEQTTPGKSGADYEKAFDALRKNVIENYVQVDMGVDPALDPFEETYHLLQYFEAEKDKEMTFKTYWNELKETLRR